MQRPPQMRPGGPQGRPQQFAPGMQQRPGGAQMRPGQMNRPNLHQQRQIQQIQQRQMQQRQRQMQPRQFQPRPQMRPQMPQRGGPGFPHR